MAADHHEELVVFATADEVATWSPDALFLRMSQFVAAHEGDHRAQDVAANTLELWHRLHPEAVPPRVN